MSTKSVRSTAEITVIGAGIAGLSVAAELSKDASVIVLERETQPGYHATGRSAAYFSPAYGNAVVRGLTAASEEFYKAPPSGFSESPLLLPRDAIHIAPAGFEHVLANAVQTISSMRELEVSTALAAVPVLKAGYVAAAAEETGGGDLDVNAILYGYLRGLKRNGGTLLTGEEVISIRKTGAQFVITTPALEITSKIIVNAAGAWADQIAQLAGIAPVGLTPQRRTAFLVPPPPGMATESWPLVINEVHPLYFKPDAGALLISPMDATPGPACDAAPEELDVAEAAARFEACTTVRIQRITHRWAGLRTFAPDDTFVAGFDPQLEGFFWLAGQGGYGVQTAPALSRLAASLIARADMTAAADSLTKEKGPEWAFKEAVAPARFRS